MYTPEIIILLVSNVALIITVLSLLYPRVKQAYTKRKKLRETKAKQGRALDKAHLVRTIRAEVRKYLAELQKK